MPDKSRKEYIKQWRIKNRDKYLAQIRRRDKKKMAEAVRRYRLKPGIKEKERERQTKYRTHLKQLIFDYYGNKCNCCNESNIYFLSVDHINNDGNKDPRRKDGKRFGGRMLYHKIIKENFSNRYQILCMNCNFGKAKNNGICPHRL